MSNSGHLPPKNPERHRKITIGRATTRTHLRAERAHGTGSLSQRVRYMLNAGGHKARPLSDSNAGGLGLPSLAHPEHVHPSRPVPCAHNRPQIVPSVFVFAGYRFTYTCVYGQPTTTKGGNRYGRPLARSPMKNLFLGLGGVRRVRTL